MSLKDQSDAPAARHGLMPKTYTSSKKRTKLHSTHPREEWLLPAASTKEPEEREFVVDSGASMHVVSKKDLHSAELETMRISRNPATVMTANGEVQTREEAKVCVKQLDLLSKLCFSKKHTRSSFTRDALRRACVFLPLDQRSKTTTHPKRQEH